MRPVCQIFEFCRNQGQFGTDCVLEKSLIDFASEAMGIELLVPRDRCWTSVDFSHIRIIHLSPRQITSKLVAAKAVAEVRQQPFIVTCHAHANLGQPWNPEIPQTSFHDPSSSNAGREKHMHVDYVERCSTHCSNTHSISSIITGRGQIQDLQHSAAFCTIAKIGLHGTYMNP